MSLKESKRQVVGKRRKKGHAPVISSHDNVYTGWKANDYIAEQLKKLGAVPTQFDSNATINPETVHRNNLLDN